MLKKFLALPIILALFVSGFNFHISKDSFNPEEAKTLAKLYGDAKILICTSSGFKHVSFAELADNISGGKTHKTKKNCPTCLSTHLNKSFTGENPAIVIDIAFLFFETLKPAEKTSIISAESSAYSARSPPRLS